jgi:hypothetical protein
MFTSVFTSAEARRCRLSSRGTTRAKRRAGAHPTPRRCSLSACGTTSPLYNTTVSQVLRQTSRSRAVRNFREFRFQKCLGEGESVVPRIVETRPFGQLRLSIAAKFEVDASLKLIFGRFERKSPMGVRDVGHLCPPTPGANSPSLRSTPPEHVRSPRGAPRTPKCATRLMLRW